jgi:membrane-associated phospholipid phosphatase
VRPFVRRRVGAAFAVFVVAASGQALARERVPDELRPYWRRNIFKRIALDQPYLFKTWLPAELARPGFSVPVFTATTIALAGSLGGSPPGGIDARLELAIYSGSGPRAKNVAHAFTSLGNPQVVLAIIGMTYLGGHFGHDDRLAEASSLAFEAFVDAGIWNIVLKEATARVRPGQPGQALFFQYGAADNQSYPSGHAMIAFSVATVYAEEYRDRRWVGALAYGSATMIALSRVVLGRHFPADVIVGGVLGASFGHMVVARSRAADDETPVRARFVDGLQPIYEPSRQGVGLGWSRSW